MPRLSRHHQHAIMIVSIKSTHNRAETGLWSHIRVEHPVPLSCGGCFFADSQSYIQLINLIFCMSSCSRTATTFWSQQVWTDRNCTDLNIDSISFLIGLKGAAERP